MGDMLVLNATIKDLNDRFYLILNDLVKSYPSAHLNNDKVLYNANMKKMMSLQNDYFLYKNDLVSAIEKSQGVIKAADDKINTIEGQNKVLKIEYESLKDSSHSAEGLFDDALISRNQLLFSNFILFAVICGGGYAFYKRHF